MEDKEHTIGLKTVAVFMCYLVLSLTLFSAFSARAEAVFSASIHGQDNIQGYRRVNDTTTVSVITDYDMVTLLPPGSSDGLELSCSPRAEGYGYLCTYSFSLETQTPREYTLRVKPGDQDPRPVTYSVDSEAPIFSTTSFQEIPGGVKGIYTLTDMAYQGSTNCPGIGVVRLIANDDVISEKLYNETRCADSSFLEASFPGIEGNVELYLYATDKLGNTGFSDTYALTVDTISPSLPSGFSLVRGGVAMSMISNESITDIEVDLNFTIVESNLNSVSVDVSELNPTAGYGTMQPECYADGNINHCQVRGLILKPENETMKIHLIAIDDSGNRAEGDVYTSLTIVNTRPSVTYIGRADRQCDTCFLRKGSNPIQLMINAPGGMVTNTVGLRLGTTPLPLVNCTNVNGDIWACETTAFISRTAGTLKLQVLPNSMDDLGNPATGFLEKNFTIDSQKPRVIGQPTLDINCPTAGQQLHITTIARDSLSPTLTIAGNVSNITDRNWVSNVCADPINESSSDFSCVLVIDSFVSVHTEADVPLVIYDEAGNNVSLELRNFEVCEANTDVTPNFITSLQPSIIPLPSVDKRVASITKYRVLIPLGLTMVESRERLEPIQVRRTSCDGIFTPGPSYVMNEFTRYPMLVTHFYSQGLWPNVTVPLNCTLDFTIRKGNVVYIQPESETLNLALPLTRLERGLPGEAIVQKRNDLVGEINKLQDKIDSKAKIDQTLGELCRLAEMLSMIPAILAMVKTAVAPVALAAWQYGGMGLWAAINQPFSGIQQKIETYVWPPNWIPSSFGGPALVGFFIKWICSIYSCALYNPSTWSSFTMELGARQGWLGMGEGALADQGNDVVANPEDGTVATVHYDNGDVTYTYDDNAGTWTGSNGDVVSQAHINSQTSLGTVSVDGNTMMTVDYDNGDVTYTYDAESDEWVDSDGYAVNQDHMNFQSSLGTAYYTTTVPDREAGAFYRGLAVGAIKGDDWVVNPYRSTKYDGLCFPAQLYNLRKEKQIKCIELKCIDEMATSGLPITQCEQRYAAQHCLYVEGAQSRTHHSMSDIIVDLFTAVALQIISGVAIQWVMAKTCTPLYDAMDLVALASMADTPPGEPGQLRWNLPDKVYLSVGCSLVMSALAIKNLGDVMGGGLRGSNPAVPTGPDFCEGIDDVVIDESALDEGWI